MLDADGVAVAGAAVAAPHAVADRRSRLPLLLPGRDARTVLGLAVVALLGGFWLTARAWLHDPSVTWAGDIGDPEQFQFFLAWPAYAIGHGLNPLFTDYVLWPTGTNLMWNTAVTLPALLATPVTVLFGPTVTYNLLVLLAPAFTALTGFWAFRRWAGRAGAAVGALCFAFAPFVAAQSTGHLHLVLLCLVPVFLALVDELLVRQRWPWWVTGGALGVAAAAQLLTSEEVLALTVLVAGLATVLLAVFWRRQVRRAWRYAGKALLAAAAAFAVLAGYPLYFQFAGPLRVGSPIHDPRFYVNDLLNVVVPVNTWLGSAAAAPVSAQWTGNATEWNGYLGVPLLLGLAFLLARAWRRPLVRTVVALVALGLTLSFGFFVHVGGSTTPVPGPWAVFEHAPVLKQVIPARLGLYADLFAALAVALLVDEVGRLAHRSRRLLGGLGVAAIALSWVPASLPASTLAQPAYFAADGPVQRLAPGTLALVLPMVVDPNTEHAMVWQVRAGFPFLMPEGDAIVPGSHYGPTDATMRVFTALGTGDGYVSPDERAALLAEWRSWRLDRVIAAPYAGQDTAVRFLTDLLGRRPTWYGDTAVFTLRDGR